MTGSTERRLAGALTQISELLDSRLPQEGSQPAVGFAMWQFWVVIGTMVFYSGATWIQIQDNSKAIAKHTAWDAKNTDKMQAAIKENEDNLAAHLQWELEHEISIKNAEIKKLRTAR